MIFQQLYKNKKMTFNEKIKVIIKKNVYKICTYRYWKLSEDWINKYAEYEDLIFYQTEEELEEKINKKSLNIKHKYESKLWRRYGG